QADDARDGRAAHDAVVHEDDPFAAHGGGDGVELYAHGVLEPCLAGLDEGAADVLALHEAHAVGSAALASAAQGRVDAGVRHADDDVGLNGVLQGQEGARALARRVYAAAVYDGVRAREVDELEDALARGLPAVAAVALKAPVGDGDYLARLHVAQELCAY